MSTTQNTSTIPDQKPVFRHTRTISIVSDSTISRLQEDTLSQPDNTTEWPVMQRSPSASSFFSFTSEQFYDCFDEPKVLGSQTSVGSLEKVVNGGGFVNKAFVLDESPFQLQIEDPIVEKPNNERKPILQQYWECSHFTKRETCCLISIVIMGFLIIVELGVIIFIAISKSDPVPPTFIVP